MQALSQLSYSPDKDAGNGEKRNVSGRLYRKTRPPATSTESRAHRRRKSGFPRRSVRTTMDGLPAVGYGAASRVALGRTILGFWSLRR